MNKELGIGIVLLSNYCYASIFIVDHYFDQLIKLITKKEPSQGVFVDPIGKKIMEAIMQR